MQLSYLFFLTVLSCVQIIYCGTFQAGVAKVDGTLPIGAPLAGYNYPPRRVDSWPLPYLREFTTWMEPNQGSWDPTWVKGLVIDDGSDRFAFVTIDAIGSDGVLSKMGWEIAVAGGFTVPFEKCMFSSAHTHSGPGAISSAFLWSIAPATDLMVPSLQAMLANSIAQALLQAEQNLAPALIDVGITNLTGVTHNRRSGFSPYVTDDYVDHQLGIFAINHLNGTPLATIWNFAIHGICYDAPNMKYTTDVMGSASDWIEANVGGVAMFWNADAGDVNPIFDVACVGGPVWSGGKIIGTAVQQLRSTLSPSSQITMRSASEPVEFGLTHLNLTLQRLDNCTKGGPLDICSFCMFLHCDADIQLPESWIEETPIFSAFQFSINNKNLVVVSIPGEAFTALGFAIKNDTASLGFDLTFLAGYSNNHLGYFAPTDEYDIGGYESLLTFWGSGTADKVRESCKSVATLVA